MAEDTRRPPILAQKKDEGHVDARSLMDSLASMMLSG